jgi:hypothetical protein
MLQVFEMIAVSVGNPTRKRELREESKSESGREQ